MSKYHTVLRLEDGIFHLFEPSGVGCTLVLGQEKALLFDTGHGLGDLLGAVRSITDLPVVLVNSHGHIDHVGGNWQFASAYIHPADKELAERHVSREKREWIIRMKFSDPKKLPENFSVDTYTSRTAGEWLPVEDGQSFELGGRSLRVIHTPGHTHGCICLLDEQTRTLLTGDLVAPVTWMFLPESTTIGTFVQSLERLREWDFEKIIVSHLAGILRRGFIDRMLQCARNIDVAGSRPFPTPLAENVLVYREGGEPGTRGYVSIAYTRDKLDL
ncbi:MBL fold metallo-hydrolase [Staphylospora marina]|uniref:MBL fold metallo-hydrolase n=1 Tax=Staphylospora marina TaxID=2490858 RepID=UPI000F5BDCAF|nr:MBL fold metallo-hydrolase [Staphylospora marina]